VTMTERLLDAITNKDSTRATEEALDAERTV
jgi:hypothetical protein